MQRNGPPVKAPVGLSISIITRNKAAAVHRCTV